MKIFHPVSRSSITVIAKNSSDKSKIIVHRKNEFYFRQRSSIKFYRMSVQYDQRRKKVSSFFFLMKEDFIILLRNIY